MRIDIVSVFPDMIAAVLDCSIVKRARERGLIEINTINLRDYTLDRHKTTDDQPYGGGGGMVMRVEPIARALEALQQDSAAQAQRNISGSSDSTAITLPTSGPNRGIIAADGVLSSGQDAAFVPDGETREGDLLSPIGSWGRPRIAITDPRGPRFVQATAQQWAQEQHLVLLCGHYEGVDERVRQHLVTDEISIGDYILTGGELPALIIVDAITRLQAGALGDQEAPDKDTFADDLLEYPHFTRPQEFRGWSVPDILLSGHHALIEKWRKWHRLRATRERRPDLFARLNLSPQDIKLLNGEEPTAPADPKAAAKTPGMGTLPDTQAE